MSATPGAPGGSGVGFETVTGEDARQVPTRILIVQEEARPPVHLHDDEMVMTFPHLLVRELITLVGASLLIVLLAIVFDAPLEELANPQRTPNPAKAPWYFLGLQELLHYYPPLVAGVVLPGVVVLSLVVVPYFDVNVRRTPFWESGRTPKILGVLAATAGLSAFFYATAAHPVWPLIGPTLAIGAVMLLPGILGTRRAWLHWLGTRSLPFWIFVWFILDAAALTVIGTFFRGPGWSFTLPWRDGIF